MPLVTRDRQPWHSAVEEEICRGLGRPGGFTIDDVVNAVLSRDSDFPPDSVRRYTQFILEASAGMLRHFCVPDIAPVVADNH